MTTWSSLVTANWGECAEDHQCDKKNPYSSHPLWVTLYIIHIWFNGFNLQICTHCFFFLRKIIINPFLTTKASLILFFIFRGFREHPILFRPTYKYDPGTDEFDTSTKQRIPSYTDRYYNKRSTSFFRTNFIFRERWCRSRNNERWMIPTWIVQRNIKLFF